MEAEVRPLPKFDYVAPASLSEALKLLRDYQERARVLAGGTDLVVRLKKHLAVADVIVDLNGISELSCIESVGDHLHIGGLTRLTQIKESPVVKERASALTQAISVMASPPIRNRGTIGGNLCNSSPAADTAPPLLALDASVKLQSADGERIVSLSQFFVGPEENVLRADEILTEVIIPLQEGNTAFLKLGRRKAFTLSVVSVAAYARTNDGRFDEVRVALGAVAPTPMRGLKVEEALRGGDVSEKAIEKSAELVKEEVRPITDVRASAEYRREISHVLTKRVLEKVGLGGKNEGKIQIE
jgi:probable selenate reductase FAD-binding subunit